MFESIFNNKGVLWSGILAFACLTLFHLLSTLWLIDLPSYVLFYDAAARSFLLVGIIFFLWNIFRYGNFSSLPLMQKAINYIALTFLLVAVSEALSIGFDYLLGKDVMHKLLPFLPVSAFIQLTITMAFIRIFSVATSEEKDLENDDETEGILEDNLEINENNLEEKFQPEHEIIERVAVKSGQKIHVIMVPDILYIQADGDYVHIFSKNGKFLKEETMKYFQEHLPQELFVRVHRSYIVNVEAISGIELYEKQTQQLTLKNGDKIKASQQGYRLLKERLKL